MKCIMRLHKMPRAVRWPLTLGLLMSVALAQVAGAGAQTLPPVPQEPYQIYGNVTAGGSPAPQGLPVVAQINGVAYVATVTDASGRYGYSPAFFRVPADDPSTATVVEGGVAGDTVQLYVNGTLAGTTTFAYGVVAQVDLSIPGAVTPPTVTTNTATVVTDTSATLNGTLGPMGTASSAYVYFSWGTTTSYGNTTSPQTSTGGAFSAGIGGLTAGVTYHFRAQCFAGANGTSSGADMTFIATAGGAATVTGTVTLQGSGRPAAGRQIPVTVKLFPAGQSNANLLSGTGAIATSTPTTIDSGTSTVTFVFPASSGVPYDITVVSAHTLMNVKQNVTLVAGANAVNFGTLLEGDVNGDSVVNILDFSALASAYHKQVGQPGFNAAADFNYDGSITILDFSLLASNYLKTGPVVVP